MFNAFLCDNGRSSVTVHFVSMVTKDQENRTFFFSLQMDCKALHKAVFFKRKNLGISM